MATVSTPDPAGGTAAGTTPPPAPTASASAGVSPEDDVARAGRWPLIFVAGALLALAVLPIMQERRIASIERRVEDVLEPAGRLGREMTLIQARQMARFQAYLLTGEPSLRLRYRELAEREQAVQDELRVLSERADLDIDEPLARLGAVSRAWHVAHQEALDADSLRSVYVANARAEQARYDSVLAAARGLEEAVTARVEEGRQRMDRARTFQVWLIVGLALLALIATAALVFIGRRLQQLVREAEERRREALRARREMLAVLEATGDGVVGLDLTGTCRTLNRTATELLGYKELEVQGRDVHGLLHGKAPGGEPHEPEDCPVVEALRSGVTERRTDDIVWRRDGTAFPATWHLRPLLDGRVLRGAVLTISDTTDIREAEDALKRAVRAREEVVAMVSHDLRNPLGTVIAAVDLLLDPGLELDADTRRTQLATVRRASQNMRRLIEDLLDVSRIEAEGLTVDPRPSRLRPLVDDAVDLVAGAAAEKGVTVENAVADDLRPVMADGDRVIQVLSNLIGNGVKFTEEGGRVRVAAVETGEGVAVEVTDDGRGIERDHLDHLFDRFWQVQKGDRQGAGLGLTIVKGIVQAHGGWIRVESEPGRGSTFRFLLPCAAADGGSRPDVPESGEGDAVRGSESAAQPRRRRAGMA